MWQLLLGIALGWALCKKWGWCLTWGKNSIARHYGLRREIKTVLFPPPDYFALYFLAWDLYFIRLRVPGKWAD